MTLQQLRIKVAADCLTMNDLDVDHQTCVSVYRAAHSISRFYAAELKPYGMTFPGLQVMMVLWSSKECTVGRICGKLALDTSTITPLLKRLESMGFVRRFRDRLDERKVIVILTEKGDEFRDEAVVIRAKFVRQSGLGLDELASIKCTLDTVTERMPH